LPCMLSVNSLSTNSTLSPQRRKHPQLKPRRWVFALPSLPLYPTCLGTGKHHSAPFPSLLTAPCWLPKPTRSHCSAHSTPHSPLGIYTCHNHSRWVITAPPLPSLVPSAVPKPDRVRGERVLTFSQSLDSTLFAANAGCVAARGARLAAAPSAMLLLISWRRERSVTLLSSPAAAAAARNAMLLRGRTAGATLEAVNAAGNNKWGQNGTVGEGGD
jgi:hypothetical protein